MAFEAARSVTLIPVSTLIPRGRGVTIDSSGNAALATANTTPVGITLEESPANSQVAISVALLDGAKVEVEAGAAIARGARVAMAGAGADAGRADDTASANTVRYFGVALEAATAAGQIITVLTAKDAGLAQAT